MSRLRYAAIELNDVYGNEPWFVSVGIADNSLILYVSSKKWLKKLERLGVELPHCLGVPIEMKVMGKPRPCWTQEQIDDIKKRGEEMYEKFKGEANA